MKLELRPYQEDALARVAAARERGVLRQLGVAATGMGKTVMFCALAERMGCRTLILAHRDELIDQAAKKVREVIPGADVGIVKAERREVGCDVVVASVQTLARTSRMSELTAPFADESRFMALSEPFGLVVVDEAHHAAAESYRRILGELGCNGDKPWDQPLLLGVTATPDRGDGKGLDDLFDEIVFNYDILWGIRSQYLCDVRGLQVKLTGFDESELKVSRGDYEQGQAGKMLTDAGAPAAIVKAWQKHAAGRRTIVFTPTVALAQEVSDAFRHAGVLSEMVHGGTPLDERRAMLRRFSNGETMVMANCAVLTEGYDNPAVDCIVVARPTTSRALYTQMLGRGTRRHPDKDHLLVLDVVGASAQHSLLTVPSLFGLEDKFRKRGDGGELVSGLVEEQEVEQVRIGKISAKEVELFHKIRADGIAWVKLHKDGEPRRYARGLGKEKPTVVLHERDAGLFRVTLLWRDGKTRVLIDAVEMELAQGVGEDYVRKMGDGGLHHADAKWRDKKPSAKALHAAERWHIKVNPHWKAGELADALDAAVAKANIRNAMKLAAERAAQPEASPDAEMAPAN